MRLNGNEIRLIVAILLALTIGAAVKHYRTAHTPLKFPASVPTQPHDPDGVGR